MVVGRGPALRASSHWRAVASVAARGVMRARPWDDHASPTQPTPTPATPATPRRVAAIAAAVPPGGGGPQKGGGSVMLIAYIRPPPVWAAMPLPLSAARRRNSLSVGMLCSRGIGWATLVDGMLR